MSANEQKTSRELAIIAAQAADEKKATDILVQDVAKLVGETDFFVIVTASNSRQVNSIVDAIKEDLRDKGGVKPFHVEGTRIVVAARLRPDRRARLSARDSRVLPPRGAVERRPRARFGEGSGALRRRVLRPHLEASAQEIG